MSLNFTTTKASAKQNGVKMLSYGKAGTGKTCACATAPNPFIFSCENGLLSLRNTDIPVASISTIAELDEAYDWCVGSAESKKYDTICLDSYSEIAETILAEKKESNKDIRRAYGELIDRVQIISRKFRDLPEKHVYLTAKEKRFVDETNGIVTYSPSMPGNSLSQEVPYFFDELFHAHTVDKEGQTYYCLRTHKTMQIDAKDRSGVLNEIEENDLGKIIRKILG